MIEWIKGNPDNLEGRVAVFSQYTGSFDKLTPEERRSLSYGEEKTRFLCYYASLNVDDFIKETKVPKELINQNRKFIRETKNKDLKINYYIAKILLLSDNDARCKDADVIFSGKWNSVAGCFYSLDVFVELYIRKYSEQTLGKESIPGKNRITALAKRESLEDFLRRSFVNQLSQNLRTGDINAFKRIEVDFFNYTKDEPYSGEVRSLCSFMRITDPYNEKTKTIIGLYLGKIDAIKKEDYERAGAISRELKLLLVSKSP